MIIVVTGAGGLLGSNIIKYIRENLNNLQVVIPVYHGEKRFTAHDNKDVYMDIRNEIHCRQLNTHIKLVSHYLPNDANYPVLVIHCAAITQKVMRRIAQAQGDDMAKKICWETNVLGTGTLLRALERNGMFVVSTDYVFNGKNGMYKTTDVPDPVSENYYAFSKACQEAAALTNRGGVIRCSFFDNTAPNPPAPKCFTDQYCSRLGVTDIAAMIANYVANIYPKSPQIVHLGGPRRSVYDIVSSYGYKVEPCSVHDVMKEQNISLPIDTSLELTEFP